MSCGERATGLGRAAPVPAHSSAQVTREGTLTPDVVLSTVQRVSSVDKLVPGATHPQLRLGVAQDDLPPVRDGEHTQLRGRAREGCQEWSTGSSAAYLGSHAKGVKSSLCFVLKIMFLVRICRMDGGCRGVEMANRASCGGRAEPSADLLFCP